MFIRKVILTFLMVTTSLFAIAEDKTWHMQTSMMLTYTGQVFFDQFSDVSHSESVIYATGISLAIGLGKELYDEQDYGGFSSKDLAADLVGALSGALLSDYFDHKYFFRIEHDTVQKKSKIVAEYKF